MEKFIIVWLLSIFRRHCYATALLAATTTTTTVTAAGAVALVLPL